MNNSTTMPSEEQGQSVDGDVNGSFDSSPIPIPFDFDPTNLSHILFNLTVDSLFTHTEIPTDNSIAEIVTRDRKNFKDAVVRYMNRGHK